MPKETILFLPHLLTDPKFENSSEERYAVPLLEREERSVARTYLLLAAFAWIPLVVMRLFGEIGFYESSIITTFHVAKAMVSVGLLLADPSPRILRRSVFTMLLTAQIVWTVGAWVGSIGGTGPKWLSSYWIILMLCGNAFLPVRSWGHNLIFVVSFVSAFIVLRDYPNPAISHFMTFACLFIAQNYRIMTHRMIKLAAIQSFREQSRFIPRQVLLASADRGKSILEIFAPANRYCVCICSDWRNFQVLSSRVPMARLGQGLADYYQDIVDMFYRRLPDGEFFVDWIADELFVVLFARDDGKDERLLKEAFAAAVEIVKYREEFAGKTGFPDGIDVGISCGIASVGIFASEGVSKATAFGDTPGIARALQAVAKDLRQTLGSCDRIVMLPAVAAANSGQDFEFTKVEAAAHDSEGSLVANDISRLLVWSQPNSMKKSA